MGTINRLEGIFTAKVGDVRQPFLAYESGPGTLVTFVLQPGTTIQQAQEMASQMNKQVVSVSIAPTGAMRVAQRG
jgi:hypothetical protein